MWTRTQIEAGASALADWLEQHVNPVIAKLMDGQNPNEVLAADSKAGPIMQAFGYVDEALIAIEDAGHHARTLVDLFAAYEAWKGFTIKPLDPGSLEGEQIEAERDATMN